jgi:hypothetical protein
MKLLLFLVHFGAVIALEIKIIYIENINLKIKLEWKYLK